MDYHSHGEVERIFSRVGYLVSSTIHYPTYHHQHLSSTTTILLRKCPLHSYSSSSILIQGTHIPSRRYDGLTAGIAREQPVRHREEVVQRGCGNPLEPLICFWLQDTRCDETLTLGGGGFV